ARLDCAIELQCSFPALANHAGQIGAARPMPFMALMAAPLSAMLSVTGGDGSLDYPSHTRARTADSLFWRHHVSPTRASGWGAPISASRSTRASSPRSIPHSRLLRVIVPRTSAPLSTACRPYNRLRLRRRSGEPSPVSELGPWERVLSE